MPVDTRTRILDTSRRLFTDQGYEATSLRQISDELGVTKAALYYHFQSKDQILRALLEPADELIRDLLERLEAATSVAEWGDALEWVIDAMGDALDFFRLVMHNRSVIEGLIGEFENLNDHQQMHVRVQNAMLSVSDDLTDRVRMIAALGAVTGFDDWAPDLLIATPHERLREELGGAVRELLGLRDPAGAT